MSINTNWSNDPNKTQVDWTKIATINHEATLRVPSGQRVTYSAEDDGIREVIDTVDQFGDSMYATTKLVLSKEVFVAAYNAYISDELKRLEKSNRNWRRKCQRLRNKKNSEMIKPEEGKWVIVRDEDGKEYPYHQWNGTCWYSYVGDDEQGYDGWRSDVNVVSWRYQ